MAKNQKKRCCQEHTREQGHQLSHWQAFTLQILHLSYALAPKSRPRRHHQLRRRRKKSLNFQNVPRINSETRQGGDASTIQFISPIISPRNRTVQVRRQDLGCGFRKGGLSPASVILSTPSLSTSCGCFVGPARAPLYTCPGSVASCLAASRAYSFTMRFIFSLIGKLISSFE